MKKTQGIFRMKKKIVTILFISFFTLLSVSSDEWRLLKKAPFTVEHYLIQKDGTYSSLPNETEVKYDYPGKPYNISINQSYEYSTYKDFQGYQLDKTNSVWIAEDGSTVIRNYYKSEIEFEFIMEYDVNIKDSSIYSWADNPDDHNGSRYITVSIYDDLVIPVPVKKGYIFKGWNIMVFEAGRHDASYHYEPFFRGYDSVPVKKVLEFMDSLSHPRKEFWDYIMTAQKRFEPEWEKAN